MQTPVDLINLLMNINIHNITGISHTNVQIIHIHGTVTL